MEVQVIIQSCDAMLFKGIATNKQAKDIMNILKLKDSTILSNPLFPNPTVRGMVENHNAFASYQADKTQNVRRTIV